MLKLGEQNVKELYLGEQEIKKAYLGEELILSAAKPSGLPDGYTKLEYIESTGVQYIDLGVLLSEESSIEFDITPLSFSYLSIAGFWDRTGNTTSNYRFTQFVLNSSQNYQAIRAGLSYHSSNASPSLSALTYSAGSRISLLVDLKNKIFKVNEASTRLDTPTGFNTTCPLYLFGTNRRFSGVTQTPINLSVTRLYSCRIYNNEVLSHNYIPCVNPSGVIGLYDSVDSTFLQNAGTGTFTAGPIV